MIFEEEYVKAFQRWLGIILMGAASLALFVACNDDNSGGSNCVSDSDCRGDRICDADTGTCDWVPCNGAEDCPWTQDCVERDNGSSVCMLADDNPDDPDDPDDDDVEDTWCLADSDCGAGEICNYEIEECAVQCEQGVADTCLADEACIPRENADGAICVPNGFNADPGCTADADCGAGELCNFETEECAFECDPGVDDMCVTGEVCAQRESASGAICVAGQNPNNDSGGCESVDDCPAGDVCEAGFCEEPCEPDVCAEGYICNENTGICEEDTGPSGQYRFIKVTDTTTVTSMCEVPDPGSDIMGVEVSTDSGAYWARVISADGIVTQGNDFTDAGWILDGRPPNLVDGCPDAAFADSVVSLGCSGNVIVEFVDEDGTPVFLSSGDHLTVYEFGAQCGGAYDDEWRAEVCTTTSESDIYAGNCQGRTLGGGSGNYTVTIN